LDFNIDDRSKLSQLVEKLIKMFHIIFNIIKLGKISIIIGGGHNAYGNIKGSALAKGQSMP
jgi:formiminoglutamase